MPRCADPGRCTAPPPSCDVRSNAQVHSTLRLNRRARTPRVQPPALHVDVYACPATRHATLTRHTCTRIHNQPPPHPPSSVTRSPMAASAVRLAATRPTTRAPSAASAPACKQHRVRVEFACLRAGCMAGRREGPPHRPTAKALAQASPASHMHDSSQRGQACMRASVPCMQAFHACKRSMHASAPCMQALHAPTWQPPRSRVRERKPFSPSTASTSACRRGRRRRVDTRRL
jgi:hypothetical protein